MVEGALVSPEAAVKRKELFDRNENVGDLGEFILEGRAAGPPGNGVVG